MNLLARGVLSQSSLVCKLEGLFARLHNTKQTQCKTAQKKLREGKFLKSNSETFNYACVALQMCSQRGGMDWDWG